MQAPLTHIQDSELGCLYQVTAELSYMFSQPWAPLPQTLWNTCSVQGTRPGGTKAGTLQNSDACALNTHPRPLPALIRPHNRPTLGFQVQKWKLSGRSRNGRMQGSVAAKLQGSS